MPVFFVDEDILNHKLECVLCPIKGNQLYFYKDIDYLLLDIKHILICDLKSLRQRKIQA